MLSSAKPAALNLMQDWLDTWGGTSEPRDTSKDYSRINEIAQVLLIELCVEKTAEVYRKIFSDPILSDLDRYCSLSLRMGFRIGVLPKQLDSDPIDELLIKMVDDSPNKSDKFFNLLDIVEGLQSFPIEVEEKLHQYAKGNFEALLVLDKLNEKRDPRISIKTLLQAIEGASSHDKNIDFSELVGEIDRETSRSFRMGSVLNNHMLSGRVEGRPDINRGVDSQELELSMEHSFGAESREFFDEFALFRKLDRLYLLFCERTDISDQMRQELLPTLENQVRDLKDSPGKYAVFAKFLILGKCGNLMEELEYFMSVSGFSPNSVMSQKFSFSDSLLSKRLLSRGGEKGMCDEERDKISKSLLPVIDQLIILGVSRESVEKLFRYNPDCFVEFLLKSAEKTREEGIKNASRVLVIKSKEEVIKMEKTDRFKHLICKYLIRIIRNFQQLGDDQTALEVALLIKPCLLGIRKEISSFDTRKKMKKIIQDILKELLELGRVVEKNGQLKDELSDVCSILFDLTKSLLAPNRDFKRQNLRSIKENLFYDMALKCEAIFNKKHVSENILKELSTGRTFVFLDMLSVVADSIVCNEEWASTYQKRKRTNLHFLKLAVSKVPVSVPVEIHQFVTKYLYEDNSLAARSSERRHNEFKQHFAPVVTQPTSTIREKSVSKSDFLRMKSRM